MILAQRSMHAKVNRIRNRVWGVRPRRVRRLISLEDNCETLVITRRKLSVSFAAARAIQIPIRLPRLSSVAAVVCWLVLAGRAFAVAIPQLATESTHQSDLAFTQI